MNFLTPSSATKLATFQKQAQAAYSIFTKAVDDLAATNERIKAEISMTEQQMKDLAAFTDSLNAQKTANDKVVSRIKTIIED